MLANIRDTDFDPNNPQHVYIGRENKNFGLEESKWASPFSVGEDGTTGEVLQAYRAWIRKRPDLMNSLEELRGKTLFSLCDVSESQGVVLLELLGELAVHPVADLFPPMTEEEFRGLKEDIRQHGQREDIVVWCGQLIDGRHRLRACRELGIKPQIAELMEETDPVQYALSHNLHRRHLTTAQRAMVAAKLATYKKGDNQHSKEHSGIPLTTQTEAATALNVSVDSLKQARKIRAKASPEVVSATERGDMTLNAAVATIKDKPAKGSDTSADKSSSAVHQFRSTLPRMERPQLTEIIREALCRLSRDERMEVFVSEMKKLPQFIWRQVVEQVEEDTK